MSKEITGLTSISSFFGTAKKPIGVVRVASGSDVRFVVRDGVACVLRPCDDGYEDAKETVTVPVFLQPSNALP
jgi:hypothetical protein